MILVSDYSEFEKSKGILKRCKDAKMIKIQRVFVELILFQAFQSVGKWGQLFCQATKLVSYVSGKDWKKMKEKHI